LIWLEQPKYQHLSLKYTITEIDTKTTSKNPHYNTHISTDRILRTPNIQFQLAIATADTQPAGTGTQDRENNIQKDPIIN